MTTTQMVQAAAVGAQDMTRQEPRYAIEQLFCFCFVFVFFFTKNYYL
jgi:hypothetical protein